jgi:hypothetical protein
MFERAGQSGNTTPDPLTSGLSLESRRSFLGVLLLGLGAFFCWDPAVGTAHSLCPVPPPTPHHRTQTVTRGSVG